MPLSNLMREKLKRALNARRIAIVGASQDKLSVGLGPLYNLLSAKFQGEIIPVNPKYQEIMGLKCYPDLESIEPPPELAALLLNQHAALEMTERAGRAGISAVTIVSGGFSEVGAEGEELNRRLRELAFRYHMPVIGPNSLGFSSFHHGLHSIFWKIDQFPGPVAILSQSGGVALTISYCLRDLYCGLSYFIGAGNCTVVDLPDYLEVLREDSQTGVFVLFIEGTRDPKRLYNAVKQTALEKPVIVYKAGKNEGVSRATLTHTGNLTGEYRLYSSMFRQAGAYQVSSTREAAVASKALAMVLPPRGNRLCALTFTAGPAIVAMDLLVSGGWELPEISREARQKIRSVIGEKTPVEIQNPIDLTGPGFIPENYLSVLEAVLREDFDGYLLVWGNYNPYISVPVSELETLIKSYPEKAVVVSLMANLVDFDIDLKQLSSSGICTYQTPEEAAAALIALLARRRFLETCDCN